MIAAAVALAVLIGWLVGLQALRVGRGPDARSSRATRVTTAVLGAGAALVAAPRLHAHGLVVAPDVTAVALIASVGWLVGLQALRLGSDSPVLSSRALRMTTAVLMAGVFLLAVPDLYDLMTP
jgi:hypothetical protein